jgi:hypothetical protein
MDPSTLKLGDRISHPDFGEGTVVAGNLTAEHTIIEWDRQGRGRFADDDKRWEQVELC